MSDLWREALPGVWRIDVLHPDAGQTCCYLLAAKGEGALIDCGAKIGVPVILDAVSAAGLRREEIRHIIVTHAHLDHAGAAGELMRHFPRAILGGHSSAIKHLTNPDAKLLPAVRDLYGEKFFAEHYEGVVAAEESRARVLADDETISFGGRELQILHTPGHAWHHLSVYDAAGGVFFAGDAFGVSFPDVCRGGEILIAPVMPPTQFNPEAARRTLQRLRALDAGHAALTHFDVAPNSPALADRQLAALDEWEETARAIAEKDGDFYRRFRASLEEWYRKTAPGLDSAALLRRHAGDIHLTASGFAHLHDKKFPQSAAN